MSIENVKCALKSLLYRCQLLTLRIEGFLKISSWLRREIIFKGFVKHGVISFINFIYGWLKSDRSLNCELRDSGCRKFQSASAGVTKLEGSMPRIAQLRFYEIKISFVIKNREERRKSGILAPTLKSRPESNEIVDKSRIVLSSSKRRKQQDSHKIPIEVKKKKKANTNYA